MVKLACKVCGDSSVTIEYPDSCRFHAHELRQRDAQTRAAQAQLDAHHDAARADRAAADEIRRESERRDEEARRRAKAEEDAAYAALSPKERGAIQEREDAKQARAFAKERAHCAPLSACFLPANV